MAGPQIVIASFASTDKVPGFYGEVKYGQGGMNGVAPKFLLLIGMKTASGSMAVASDIVDVPDLGTARAAAGPGSQLARMAAQAQKWAGVPIKMIAVAEGAGVAATATATVAGTWTASGTAQIRIAGKVYQVGIGALDTVTQVAANIAAAVNADQDCPVTAGSAVGVVTFTAKNKGIYGNSWKLFSVTALLPSGLTITLGGGGTVLTGGGITFAGGTLTEDVQACLDAIVSRQFDRIALGQNDTTSLGKVLSQIVAQSDALIGIRQHVIFGATGTLAAAISLAQTTVNNPRFQCAWMNNSEAHPCEIAANVAACRLQTEVNDPASMFDNDPLTGLPGHVVTSDIPARPSLVSALNNGVTPITTNGSGNAAVVRSIVTKSLTAGLPDYSTLDTSDAVVPDVVLDLLRAEWLGNFLTINVRVADDPLPSEKPRPQGVGTPSLWNTRVTSILRALERGEGYPAPILYDVSNNLPTSSYDAVGKRIMSAVPVRPMPGNHQIGVSVRQTAS